MQSNNRIFEDAARLAEGAMGTAVAMKREVETLVRAQFERILAGMDLVKRDEFEAVREMAANARAEQERLAERVAALEAALAGRSESRRIGEAPEQGHRGSLKRLPAPCAAQSFVIVIGERCCTVKPGLTSYIL